MSYLVRPFLDALKDYIDPGSIDENNIPTENYYHFLDFKDKLQKSSWKSVVSKILNHIEYELEPPEKIEAIEDIAKFLRDQRNAKMKMFNASTSFEEQLYVKLEGYLKAEKNQSQKTALSRSSKRQVDLNREFYKLILRLEDKIDSQQIDDSKKSFDSEIQHLKKLLPSKSQQTKKQTVTRLPLNEEHLTIRPKPLRADLALLDGLFFIRAIGLNNAELTEIVINSLQNDRESKLHDLLSVDVDLWRDESLQDDDIFKSVFLAWKGVSKNGNAQKIDASTIKAMLYLFARLSITSGIALLREFEDKTGLADFAVTTREEPSESFEGAFNEIKDDLILLRDILYSRESSTLLAKDKVTGALIEKITKDKKLLDNTFTVTVLTETLKAQTPEKINDIVTQALLAENTPLLKKIFDLRIVDEDTWKHLFQRVLSGNASKLNNKYIPLAASFCPPAFVLELALRQRHTPTISSILTQDMFNNNFLSQIKKYIKSAPIEKVADLVVELPSLKDDIAITETLWKRFTNENQGKVAIASIRRLNLKKPASAQLIQYAPRSVSEEALKYFLDIATTEEKIAIAEKLQNSVKKIIITLSSIPNEVVLEEELLNNILSAALTAPSNSIKQAEELAAILLERLKESHVYKGIECSNKYTVLRTISAPNNGDNMYPNLTSLFSRIPQEASELTCKPNKRIKGSTKRQAAHSPTTIINTYPLEVVIDHVEFNPSFRANYAKDLWNRLTKVSDEKEAADFIEKTRLEKPNDADSSDVIKWGVHSRSKAALRHILEIANTEEMVAIVQGLSGNLVKSIVALDIAKKAEADLPKVALDSLFKLALSVSQKEMVQTEILAKMLSDVLPDDYIYDSDPVTLQSLVLRKIVYGQKESNFPYLYALLHKADSEKLLVKSADLAAQPLLPVLRSMANKDNTAAFSRITSWLLTSDRQTMPYIQLFDSIAFQGPLESDERHRSM